MMRERHEMSRDSDRARYQRKDCRYDHRRGIFLFAVLMGMSVLMSVLTFVIVAAVAGFGVAVFFMTLIIAVS